MPRSLLVEALVAACLVTGAAFALIGSIGLARLRDFHQRLHGPTKATTLGVGGMLAASSLWFSTRGDGLSLHELLVAAFLFLTAPVSAQLMAQAGSRRDGDAGRGTGDGGRGSAAHHDGSR